MIGVCILSISVQDAFEEEFGANRGIPLPDATRWNSMLHSVKAVLNRGVTKVNKVVQDQGHPELKFNETQGQLLKELKTLLGPFGTATDKLQADKVLLCDCLDMALKLHVHNFLVGYMLVGVCESYLT